MAARRLGLRVLKLFPAEAAGGVPLLKALAGPFPDVAFCPTGGIDERNLNDYLTLPNVVCVGGSWLAPTEAVERGDWEAIRERAVRAVRLAAP